MADHAAEAEKALEAARTNFVKGSAVYAKFLSEAQIHATLAVAQQQRIANLISLDKVYDHHPTADGAEQVLTYARQLKPAIREGLNLS